MMAALHDLLTIPSSGLSRTAARHNDSELHTAGGRWQSLPCPKILVRHLSSGTTPSRICKLPPAPALPPPYTVTQ